MNNLIREIKGSKWCMAMPSCLILLFLILGCVSTNKDLVKSMPPIPMTPQETPRLQSGSLWPGENMKNSYFADYKARHVNDVVTVIVNESTTGTSKASTNTSRDTTTTAGIAGLLGFAKNITDSNDNMKTEDLSNPRIGIGGTSSNSLKGTGDTARGSTLTTRLTARVIKVMDNGNLIIEGKRQLTMNAEDQYMVLSGIIRPQDITPDNLIDSQYISDARINYSGEGVINDKMRPGWLTRIADWVWPF
ncbi:MAG: flagellar basal body L-ring protein FlgH [Syntrophales bacterium LBB04]|nr:flagellar basal body L-ring protein FlgH [Syntrophales bacterium LBB04]